MFSTIFRFEVRYWLRNPSVYIYLVTVFMLAVGSMAAAAGVFGSSSVNDLRIANSPMSIYSFQSFLGKLILFIIPAIIGNSIYRDFKSRTYHLLYSYPFKKTDFLFGKFLSSLAVVWLVSLVSVMGLVVGTQLPWVNGGSIIPFAWQPYFHVLFYYLLPNTLLLSTIVFAVVTVTRNIYAGFITVVIIFIGREIVTRISGSEIFITALLDPLGDTATLLETQSWSLIEQSRNAIPLTSSIIYNRILWLLIGSGAFSFTYSFFRFGQQATSFFKVRSGKRNDKDNFGQLLTITLPTVSYRYGWWQQLIVSWRLSHIEFRSIIRSGSFISILLAGLLLVVILLFQMNAPYETRILPVTWVMLAFPIFFYSLLVNFMTFLYAGILTHRKRISRINELVDSTAVETWALALSKWLALVKMQIVLLMVVMLAGISVQAYSGYYHFEISHYLVDLLGIHLIGFMIWAFAALLIQAVFNNSYVGLFFLLIGFFAVAELQSFGISSLLLRFNQNPDSGFFIYYSDFIGHGHALIPYFVYKSYWFVFGCLLFIAAVILWPRGIQYSLSERLKLAFMNWNGSLRYASLAVVVIFIFMAFLISKQEGQDHAPSVKQQKHLQALADKKYKRYVGFKQPRVVDVDVTMNIFPITNSFQSNGTYRLINKTNQFIDTLLIQYAKDIKTVYSFDQEINISSRDTLVNFDVVTLTKPLQPGDSMSMYFNVASITNSLLYRNSEVEKDGTYLTSLIYPSLGYYSNEPKPLPSDSTARYNHYRSIDSDFINFKAIVSTSLDQLAIAPGYLHKNWTKDDRNYFQYQSTSPVTNDYMFASGRYKVKRGSWNDIALEIYYHPSHEYILDDLMRGLKATLEYCENNVGPYQHKQVRIIEYSRKLGDFAQSFANTIPVSERSFVMDLDDKNENGLNLAFLGAAHELAHQWWGHQVIPADAVGSRMVTESMAEYISLCVLEKTYGKAKAQKFREKAMDIYLRKRVEDADEKPLVYNDGLERSYIPYQKGSLALYALRDFIGEEKLNTALRSYLNATKFQKPPYTTSVEMVHYLKQVTPDSLQYLITDLFETVTWYDNKLVKATATKLGNGKYLIEVKYEINKYQLMNGSGKLIPLMDYIEIGVFSKTNKELYLRKHRVNQKLNTVRVVVDEEPISAMIDPHYKLIDMNLKDNRIKVID